MLDRFAALAEKFEADAAGIRARAARASTATQNPMRSEAAALERCARSIRQQIEAAEQQSEDAP